MRILIPDIPKEGIDVEVEESLPSDDAPSFVKGQLRVEKVESEVMVRGSLTADIDLTCSRCLKVFVMTMVIPVDVAYHPLSDLPGDENHEITADELDLDYYADDELDIDRLLSEQVSLNIPMKPLCSEACKGLCARCGADLNVGTCACALDALDPRFRELKKFLEGGKG